MLSQFKDDRRVENDYALMKLDEAVKRQKYLELGVNYFRKHEDIYIFGYRKDDCNIKNLKA